MDSAMIASLLSYGNIAIKLAVGLIGFLWVLRTTNRCQLAQMTPVDLIGNFVMGGIIGGVIYNQDITTVQFIIVLAIWQLLVLGVNALRIHTESGQKMIVGRPTPVVIKGKYLQDKFELLGLDIADFATLSRIQGVHSLYDIWNAQIEPNGQATIQKKDARKTSNILITNGTMDTGALEMMEKDEGWLKNELHKRGYESYKDIFFAEWNELIDDERGKAEGEHPPDNIGFQPETAFFQLQNRVRSGKKPKNPEGRKSLGNHCGKSRSFYPHIKQEDKHRIQNHVGRRP